MPNTSPRYDICLCWPHSRPHLDGILEEMHDPKWGLRIIRYWYYTPSCSMTEFVDQVYSIDPVPNEHLKAKTAYLRTLDSKQCFVVLFENRDPEEKMTGTPPFRHVQSQKLNRLKNMIRDRYNPKRPDGKRTENHVQHFTDYETQTRFLLDLMDAPPLETYHRYDDGPICCAWHVPPFSWQRVRVRLEDLRVNVIRKGLRPIKDTPHWEYIRGDKAKYIKYWRATRGRECKDDHSPWAFDRLIRDYVYTEGLNNSILLGPDGRSIQDGAHRATILAARGHETIMAAKVAAWL